MDAHIKYLCHILFCQLRRIGKICFFLSTDAANKLAVSLILSRLDYCNSLLAGIPDNKLNKLQRIQNHAAQLVLRQSRHASATALLRTLHWLPVKARIQYKIACLCFQCIYQDSMPPYISDLLHPYCPSTVLGRCAVLTPHCWQFLASFLRPLGKDLSVFVPTVWNSLPLSLRKTQCFTTFKKKLKTHYSLCWNNCHRCYWSHCNDKKIHRCNLVLIVDIVIIAIAVVIITFYNYNCCCYVFILIIYWLIDWSVSLWVCLTNISIIFNNLFILFYLCLLLLLVCVCVCDTVCMFCFFVCVWYMIVCTCIGTHAFVCIHVLM